MRGYVTAYDADTGKLAWRFYTVPGDPSQPLRGADPEERRRHVEGRMVEARRRRHRWDSMAYDPELDLLYIGTGNGSPWNQRFAAGRRRQSVSRRRSSRSSRRRANTSGTTRRRRANRGTTPRRSTSSSPTSRSTAPPRKVLMQAPKNGFFYVLDRRTGKLISAKPYTTRQLGQRRRHEDRAPGRESRRALWRPTSRGSPMPGPLGAHNWQPMAFSPQTGLVYIPAQDNPVRRTGDRRFQPNRSAFNTGIDPSIAGMPQDAEGQGAGASASVAGT